MEGLRRRVDGPVVAIAPGRCSGRAALDIRRPAPTWPGHGRLWSHLISDSSYYELHAFARAVGMVRGFERDHYDVPRSCTSRWSQRGPCQSAAGGRSPVGRGGAQEAEAPPRSRLSSVSRCCAARSAPPRARGCRVEERITRGEPLQNGDPAGPELLVRDVLILLAYRSSVGRIRVRVCAQDGEVGVAQHGTVSVGRRRLVRCRQLDETNDLGDLLGFDAECRRMDAASSALVRSSSPGRPL